MADARIGAELAARVAAAWPDILDRISEGETIPGACAVHGLKRAHVRAWRVADPERLQEWNDARVASADAFADEALATARNTEVDAAYARVLVDTLKWAAAKRNPDHYADRSRHDINVKTLDLGPILARAEARLAAQRVIEGEVLRPALGAVQQSADSELDLANSLF
jgi:hypothetical protein